MMADMAIELKPYGVTCVSLYPGPVLTEETKEIAADQVSSFIIYVREDNSSLHLLFTRQVTAIVVIIAA